MDIFSYLCAMKEKLRGKSLVKFLDRFIKKADEVIRVLKGNNK